MRIESTVTFTATVGPAPSGGSVLFYHRYAGVLTTVIVPVSGGVARWSSSTLAAGIHYVQARYLGSGYYNASLSPTVTQYITADTSVKASALSVGATFYPYRDSYSDSVRIGGSTYESATVAVNIYNSIGSRVFTASLGSKTGAWAYLWNGRNTGGAWWPEGRFTVRVTSTDRSGNHLTQTGYTYLSHKRLIWHTASQTRYGDTYNVSNHSPYALIIRSWLFSRGVNLFGNILDEWAFVGYDFTLPAATRYGNLTFSAYGEAEDGPAILSIRNASTGNSDGARHTGLALGWYSTSMSASGRVSGGRVVRGYVDVLGWDYGDWHVGSVRLTYTYATLGY